MSSSMRCSWGLALQYSKPSPISYQRHAANCLYMLQGQPRAAPAPVKLRAAAFARVLNKATQWSRPATGAASSRAVSYRHATFLQQEKWRRRLHLKAGGSAAFLQTAGLRAAARGRCGSKCKSEITAQSLTQQSVGRTRSTLMGWLLPGSRSFSKGSSR